MVQWRIGTGKICVSPETRGEDVCTGHAQTRSIVIPDSSGLYARLATANWTYCQSQPTGVSAWSQSPWYSLQCICCKGLGHWDSSAAEIICIRAKCLDCKCLWTEHGKGGLTFLQDTIKVNQGLSFWRPKIPELDKSHQFWIISITMQQVVVTSPKMIS